MKTLFVLNFLQKASCAMFVTVGFMACYDQNTVSSSKADAASSTITHYNPSESKPICPPPEDSGLSYDDAIAVTEGSEWFPGECKNGDCIAGGFLEKGCGTVVELEAPDGTTTQAYIGNVCPAAYNPVCPKGGTHFDLPESVFNDLGFEGSDNIGGNNGGPDTRVKIRRL